MVCNETSKRKSKLTLKQLPVPPSKGDACSSRKRRPHGGREPTWYFQVLLNKRTAKLGILEVWEEKSESKREICNETSKKRCHQNETLIAAEGHVRRSIEAQLRVFRSYSTKRRRSWEFWRRNDTARFRRMKPVIYNLAAQNFFLVWPCKPEK